MKKFILSEQQRALFLCRRKQLHLGQKEVAHKSGISIRTIQDLETGRIHSFREATVKCLCSALDLDFIKMKSGAEDQAQAKQVPMARGSDSGAEGNGGVLINGRKKRPFVRATIWFLVPLGVILAYQIMPYEWKDITLIGDRHSRTDWVTPEGKKEFPQAGLFAEADWQNSQKVNYIEMDQSVLPGAVIPVRLKWSYFYPNGKAMVYVSAYADWDPDREIRVFDGILREKGNEIRQFELKCPKKPGIYRVRFFYALAYAPVASFYGTPPEDQQTSPAGSAYAEMTIEVLPK